MKIEDNTFIVSGGASGLGRACVADICARGGYAAILDINEEIGDELQKEINRGRAKFFKANMMETESIAAAVQGTVDWSKQTGKPIRGVIPAAGIGYPAKILDSKLQPFDMQAFDMVIGINLRGVIDLIRQTLPHIAATTPANADGERGVVIMVSSSAAFDGQPGQVAYSASKGAVAALTLPMTRDLARYGIRVVTIAPSLFDSRMTSMMSDKVKKSLERTMEFPVRAGHPEEFAQLASQSIENIMLNGVVIRLDGGMRMPSKM